MIIPSYHHLKFNEFDSLLYNLALSCFDEGFIFNPLDYKTSTLPIIKSLDKSKKTRNKITCLPLDLLDNLNEYIDAEKTDKNIIDNIVKNHNYHFIHDEMFRKQTIYNDIFSYLFNNTLILKKYKDMDLKTIIKNYSENENKILIKNKINFNPNIDLNLIKKLNLKSNKYFINVYTILLNDIQEIENKFDGLFSNNEDIIFYVLKLDSDIITIVYNKLNKTLLFFNSKGFNIVLNEKYNSKYYFVVKNKTLLKLEKISISSSNNNLNLIINKIIKLFNTKFTINNCFFNKYQLDLLNNNEMFGIVFILTYLNIFNTNKEIINNTLLIYNSMLYNTDKLINTIKSCLFIFEEDLIRYNHDNNFNLTKNNYKNVFPIIKIENKDYINYLHEFKSILKNVLTIENDKFEYKEPQKTISINDVEPKKEVRFNV